MHENLESRVWSCLFCATSLRDAIQQYGFSPHREIKTPRGGASLVETHCACAKTNASVCDECQNTPEVRDRFKILKIFWIVYATVRFQAASVSVCCASRGLGALESRGELEY